MNNPDDDMVRFCGLPESDKEKILSLLDEESIVYEVHYGELFVERKNYLHVENILWKWMEE